MAVCLASRAALGRPRALSGAPRPPSEYGVRVPRSELGERLVPTPTGFSDEVKRDAARAERRWELATGLLGLLGATGTAIAAAGLAIPPVAPFLGLAAASSFYFKLRAKWAREDPPRRDFYVVTEYRPPILDVTPLVPFFPMPVGVGLPTLLHAAGASLEATIVCVERAMGAREAAMSSPNGTVQSALQERVQEAYRHAQRTEALTAALRQEAESFVEEPEYLRDAFSQIRQRRPEQRPPFGKQFNEAVPAPVLGRLIAAGVDERLLEFKLPDDEEISQQHVGEVLSEAGRAAEDLGSTVRRWAWEASVDPSLQRQ